MATRSIVTWEVLCGASPQEVTGAMVTRLPCRDFPHPLIPFFPSNTSSMQNNLTAACVVIHKNK